MATARFMSVMLAAGWLLPTNEGPSLLSLIVVKPCSRMAAVGCQRQRPFEKTRYLIRSLPISPQLFASIARFWHHGQLRGRREQPFKACLAPDRDGIEGIIASRGICGREAAIEQGRQADVELGQ